MNYLASNMKLLRVNQKLSQATFAEKVNVGRANVAKYEGAVHEPSIEVLVKVARFFNVSLDALVTIDMKNLDLNELDALHLKSKSIFPIQVDKNGNDVIEIVPHSAQAGYAGLYSDTGFIESLDHLNLPIIPNKGKCRAFPVSGDSMPPYGDGSFVIGEYLSNRSEVKQGERYILLSRDEGIVFKRVFYKDSDRDVLVLHSDNLKYDPFEMPWSEIVEIWKFAAAITINETKSNDVLTDMMKRIDELQSDLKALSGRFS